MNTQNQLEKPVGIGYWFLMEILLIIPLINIILALIFAFTAENASKRNYFRACLIIAIVISVLYYGAMVLIANSMGSVVG
ncbi:MAG: hypothetical protein IJ881_01085 [Neisseriaceae bacterium]|nr:hypothetical protein [Neisseriaceae bacterium]